MKISEGIKEKEVNISNKELVKKIVSPLTRDNTILKKKLDKTISKIIK